MLPADIKKEDQQEASDPQTAPIFKPKAKPSPAPTAPTLETIPTRTDSDPSFEPGQEEGHQRQVIAVSVSKGPSAFFNLARKFLVTDEECDLSALEGAIVSAVDAAHLLERSQIATISRVQTSYVTVDPKKKKEPYATTAASDDGSGRFRQQQMQPGAPAAHTSPGHSQALDTLATAAKAGRENLEQSMASVQLSSHSKQKSAAGTLRRARMIITLQRTEVYKKWLEENPVQDIITGDDE